MCVCSSGLLVVAAVDEGVWFMVLFVPDDGVILGIIERNTDVVQYIGGSGMDHFGRCGVLGVLVNVEINFLGCCWG